MREKHVHKVSFYDGDYDERSRLNDSTDINAEYSDGYDGDRFSFCPECGEPLAAYWQGIDASRAAYARERDRQAELDRVERMLALAYKTTSPT